MAKKKKKLSEIKDALLAKTSYIKNHEEPAEPIQPNENNVEIEKSIFSKMKILAKLYKKEPAALINEALTHYLRIKKLDIDEALKNIVIGDDEDE